MPHWRGKSNRTDGLGRAHPCWPAGRRRSRVSRVTDPELASVPELAPTPGHRGRCHRRAAAVLRQHPLGQPAGGGPPVPHAGRPGRRVARGHRGADLAGHRGGTGRAPADRGPARRARPGSRLVPAGAGRHQRRRPGRPGRAALGQRRLRGAVRARVPDLRDRPAYQRHADRAARADGPRPGHRARNRPGRTRQDRRAPAGQGVRLREEEEEREEERRGKECLRAPRRRAKN